MEQKPLVSVLMTAYNREKYIGEAIESVLSSTYQNFELIIIDDVSNDQTVEIAKSYELKDKRVKVHINTQNLGDYPNRNRAASYATGKYLKYVDADDFIYPHGLDVLVYYMEKFPEAGYGLCSLPPNTSRPFPFQLSPSQAYEYHYFGPGLFHKAPLSSIIRRSVFETEQGFRALRMVGDFEMWHRLSCTYNVLLMPQGIVWYRVHEGQEMNDHYKYIPLYEKIKDHYLRPEVCPLPLDKLSKLPKKSIIRGFKTRLKKVVSFFIR